MKPITFILTVALALFYGSCKPKSASQDNNQTTDSVNEMTVPDMHTAEIALDYPGIYKGTIPSVSGQEINVTLTLNKDKTFEMISDFTAEKDSLVTEKGTYVIDGNIISLNKENSAPRYLRVQEGRVLLLDAEKQVITGEKAGDYVLNQDSIF